MGTRGTYFLLNKKRDFLRGHGENIVADSCVTLAEGAELGVYSTRVFDSGESGMKWHRLILDGELEGGVRVRVYASDGLPGQGEVSVREYSARDCLLFDVEGRYLWLEITLLRGTSAPVLSSVRICFPRHTWLAYLPEIYQEDPASASFLMRYLGIFQSLYEDMSGWIDRSPETLSCCCEESLEELAGWFQIPGRELWSRKQLAYLAANAPRLSAGRGTVSYVRELLWLDGERAYLVEYCKIRPYFDGGRRERQYRRLYANRPYEFTVILEPKETRGSEREARLARIVELAAPAHMQGRIVTLVPYVFLNRHTYLGINSVLGRRRPLVLDDTCALSFAVLAGEEGELS